MWWSDDVCFVQDQYAQNNFHSASSLKQQSVGWHVAPLGHNVILFQSQPVFSLPPSYYLLSRVAANRGYGFLFRPEFFFRTTHELEYFFFFCRTKREIFFQSLTLGLKTLNQIIFFSSTKIIIFFSATLGIRILY